MKCTHGALACATWLVVVVAVRPGKRLDTFAGHPVLLRAGSPRIGLAITGAVMAVSDPKLSPLGAGLATSFQLEQSSQCSFCSSPVHRGNLEAVATRRLSPTPPPTVLSYRRPIDPRRSGGALSEPLAATYSVRASRSGDAALTAHHVDAGELGPCQRETRGGARRSVRFAPGRARSPLLRRLRRSAEHARRLLERPLVHLSAALRRNPSLTSALTTLRTAGLLNDLDRPTTSARDAPQRCFRPKRCSTGRDWGRPDSRRAGMLAVTDRR